MISELGFLFIILTLVISSFSLIQIIFSKIDIINNLFNQLKVSNLIFFFTLASFICLSHSFLISDFSLNVISKNSNSQLPTIYKLTGVWGNHEGSILLWLLVMTFFGFLFSKNSSASFDFKLDEEIIRKTFLEYGALVNGKTCLHPARMCVEKSTDLDFNVNFVFELLPLMQEQKLISSYHHFSLENHLSERYYKLPTYTKTDIVACIDRLKR